MLYDSTKILLRSILLSLENAGRIRWEDQMEWAGEFSYEIHQMARSVSRVRQPERVDRAPDAGSAADRAARAIPHVKLMVRAIRRKDQVAAVESGKAALAIM